MALLGHFVGSAAAGAASGLGLRAIARFRSASAFYSAWDHFVRHCAKDHWVILTLQNGESYSGFIETADVSVASSERDMILREPAFYDKEADEYSTMQYQSLFIPGSFLSSIATVHDPTDRRIIPAGQAVFPKGGVADASSYSSDVVRGQISRQPRSASVETAGPDAQTPPRSEV